MTAGLDPYYAEAARELVLLGRDPATDLPSGVAIVGDSGEVELTLSFTMALAVSQRLTEIIAELPPPPRVLRRQPDVDRHLRALDN